MLKQISNQSVQTLPKKNWDELSDAEKVEEVYRMRKAGEEITGKILEFVQGQLADAKD